VVADALSRRPLVYAMTDISVDWKAHLLVEYSKNRFACELMDGQVQNDNFKFIDDIIYYKGQIFLVLGLLIFFPFPRITVHHRWTNYSLGDL
jgi:hypothetical protein